MRIIARAFPLFAACTLALGSAVAAQQFSPLPRPGLFPEFDAAELVPSIFFDMDGDGDSDLFAGGRTFEQVEAGTRLFAAGSPISNPDLPLIRTVRSADFDGDGDPDLVLAIAHPTDGLRLFLGDGVGGFTLAPMGSVPLFTEVADVEVVDIDADGDLDLAVAAGGAQLPFARADGILINDGSGNFSDQSALRLPGTAAGATSDVLFADIDGDNDPDFLRSFDALTGRSPELWVNDGSGAFTLQPGALPGRRTHVMSAGDFDGDLDLDLVVTSDVPPYEFLYDNDGGGTFSDAVAGRFRPLTTDELFLGAIVRLRIAHQVVDLDRDGDLDLIGSLLFSTQVRLNDGLGGFLTEAPDHPATNRAAIGDVDADGDLDVFDGKRLFTSDGMGVFADRSEHSVLPLVRAVAGAPSWYRLRDSCVDLSPALAELVGACAVDIDTDADLDVVVSSGVVSFAQSPPTLQHQLVVFSNDGSGTLSPPATTLSSPEPYVLGAASDRVVARLADLDADGDLDVVTAVSTGSSSFRQRPRLFLGDGTGQFSEAPAGQMPVDSLSVFDVELMDADADGDLDVFLAADSANRVYRNDGAGTFVDASATLLPGFTERTVAAEPADFDGDGDVDLILSNLAPLVGQQVGSTRLLRNDGAVGFSDGGTLSRPSCLARSGDLDGDGDLDLLLRDDAGIGVVYRNDGTGSFALVPGLVVPTAPQFVLDDVDRDGDLDVALDTGEIVAHLRRQCELLDLARVGGSVTIRFHSFKDDPAVTSIAVLPFVGFASARVATPIGELGTDPSLLVPLPLLSIAGRSGSVDLTLALPNDSSLNDLALDFQAIVVEAGAGVSVGLTNTVKAVVLGG